MKSKSQDKEFEKDMKQIEKKWGICADYVYYEKKGFSQALEECLKHSENIETEFDLGKFRLWIKKELEGEK